MPFARPRRLLAFVAALCFAVPVFAADDLVDLSVAPLAEAPAPLVSTFTVAGQAFSSNSDPSALALPGLPPNVRLLAVGQQDGAAFAVGLDANDAVRLWRHREREGWVERKAPPARPLPGAIKATGQAHLLTLGETASGDLELLSYHTITNAWASVGTLPRPGRDLVATPTADGFAIRATAADGSTSHTAVGLAIKKRLLTVIDWIVIVAYMGGSASIGLYFYLRRKNTSNAEFFLGGRSIPWWAAGISLYATGTSAISFIAIPAKSFATNWQLLAQNFIGLLATALVAVLIVPMIRKLNVMSVYQYLEMRFHPSIRTLSSALNIIIQLGGRMSVVLFLPSLALAAVTGIDVIWSIMLMGIVTIVYTLLGGMKAVIWTDVLQVFVMLGGAFFAIGYVVWSIEGGIPEFLKAASADSKMRTFDFGLDLRQPTVWGFMFFALFDVLTYPKDQVMMQRVLSTKDARAAGWSVWTLAAIVIPGSLTFFAIGTALYVFYQQHPERMNPLLSVDATFPHFIAAELPIGVTGLIIAGIFAASMSTLSSCMNSVATLVSVDFYERFARKPSQQASVRLAHWMTVIAGIIGVGTALLLAKFDIKSALDKSWELWSLLGGGFAGCYALGMFTRRANWQGAVIGVIGSIIITFTSWRMGLVNSVFYQTIAISSCVFCGYLGSLFFKAPAQSLLGLTVYDRTSD